MEASVRQESSPARAWAWVPTLYFAQGLPNVAAATLSVVMYKNLGVSNSDIAYYTSWLYLPWVIKPLWSPLVELLGRKRVWVLSLQLLIGAALASVGWAAPGPDFFRLSLMLFWLIAFASATHDIAADGFYLLALPPHGQAAFVGVRSLCFRLSMIAGQGGLVMLVGSWMDGPGSTARAWSWGFLLLGGVFFAAALLHLFTLPRPAQDRAPGNRSDFLRRSWQVFASFFSRPGVGAGLVFLLCYRFAESQLVKLAQPFLLDAREAGGLGLSTTQVGLAYGTAGTIALIAGGLAGGWMVWRYGLKPLIWPMALALNVPNLVYVALAATQPTDVFWVARAVALEQLGYGFGFTAYLLYMMRLAQGPHQTAHYAICTGFMALGMMLPGMASGWIQEHLGYLGFFSWVCLATLPSFAATALLRVEDGYGRRPGR